MKMINGLVNFHLFLSVWRLGVPWIKIKFPDPGKYSCFKISIMVGKKEVVLGEQVPVLKESFFNGTLWYRWKSGVSCLSPAFLAETERHTSTILMWRP